MDFLLFIMIYCSTKFKQSVEPFSCSVYSPVNVELVSWPKLSLGQFLNQLKGENGCRIYFMTNPHKRYVGMYVLGFKVMTPGSAIKGTANCVTIVIFLKLRRILIYCTEVSYKQFNIFPCFCLDRQLWLIWHYNPICWGKYNQVKMKIFNKYTKQRVY